MILISIIIPVYNAANHLDECINSLLKQSFKDCEFIFVNDGSTDDSKTIIEVYQAKDRRIKLINQENQGVSVARNIGLELASGNYVGFVDADDFIEKTYYDKLYNTAINDNCDIVVSNFTIENKGNYITNNSKYKKNIIFDNEKIQTEIISEFIKGSNLNSIWNKLYKRSIIKNINFPVGVALGEDGLFNLKAFQKANSIIFTDYSGYNYREIEGSATKNILKKDYFKRAIEVYNYNYQNDIDFSLDENNINKWKAIRLVNSVISYIDMYLKNNNGLSFSHKFNYVKNMISNKLVQNALKNYKDDVLKAKSKYEQFIVNCMTNKAIFKIILANSYSQFRNKN